MKNCGYDEGEQLLQTKIHPETREPMLTRGSLGGNLTSLPGGLCAVGSDNFKEDRYWRKFTNQFCESRDSYKVPTNWLEISHTDEILRVVKNNKKKEPCNFSLVIASPQKAIDLLSADPKSQFFKNGSDGDSTKEAEFYGLHQPLSELCDSTFSPDRSPAKPKGSGSPKGVSKIWWQLGPEKANAGLIDYKFRITKAKCTAITNQQVIDHLKGRSELAEYNLKIQQELNDMKEVLREKLKQRLPSCEIDFIDAPYIFSGAKLVTKPDGTKHLPRGYALSMLPSLTNSVTVNDTVISPEPMNEAFKKYMTAEYQKRGLTADYIENFKEGHMYKGNLHCQTHTIHVCSPEPKK